MTIIGPIPPKNAILPDTSGTVFIQNSIASNKFSDINLSLPQSLTASLDAPSTSQTINSVDSSTNSMDDLFTKLKVQDNPLNVYASYSYHIRWSMTNEYDAYNLVGNNTSGTVQLDDNIQQIVIAESGVTAAITIKDFTFTNICGPNFQTINMPATTWSMTVNEAYGIALIDKILTGANKLGVINQNRCPYFIEVWFTGYDEDGNISSEKLFYHLYRVFIMEITAQANESGTVWNINGVIDNEWANNNQNSISVSNIKIEAGTFGEFLEKLTDSFNSQTRDTLNNDITIAKYKFVCPPEIAAWPLNGPTPLKDSQRNSSFDVEAIGTRKQITISRGTDIGAMIIAAASLCPKANDWITGKNIETTNSSGGPNLNYNGLIRTLQIHSTSKIIGWDAYTGEYVREYTYTTVPYTSTKSDIDPGIAKKLNNLSVQKNKVSALTQMNRISKAYQYQYTGKNTEVLRFDISIDRVWVVALQQFNGRNTYSQKTHGPLAAPDSVAFNEAKGYNSPQGNTLRVNSKKLEDTLSKDQTNLANTTGDTKILEGQVSKDQAAVDANNAQLANVQVQEHSQSVFYFDQLNSNPEKLQSSLSGLSSANQNILSNLSSHVQQVQNGTNPRGIQYAEDQQLLTVNQDDKTPQNSWQIVSIPQKKPWIQNSDRNSDSAKDIQATVDNNLSFPQGRGLFGTVLGNIMDRTTFLQIDIEVRGDPYWMGLGNIEMDHIVTQYAGDISKNTANYAQYISGDELFVLNFRIPTSQNEDTGLMDFNTGTGTMFNGLYRAMTVEHQFRDGRFTQKINAFKDVYSQLVDPSLSAQTTDPFADDTPEQKAAAIRGENG